MTTLEAKKRREELGEDNDRATLLFIAGGCAVITVAWASFLVWLLV